MSDSSRGLCECGCGKPTNIAAYNLPRLGWVKGEPIRFLRGHSGGGHTQRTPMETRFWAKVDKHGPIPAHNPSLGRCWIWRGAITPNGYGMLYDPEADNHRNAHRFSYELSASQIGPGLVIDHLCRVRHCVRPDHLEAVPQSVNVRRGKNGVLGGGRWG